MAIIGWATGVNKKILDSTGITVGDKGYVEDSGDSSAFQERRLTSLYSPDTYTVTMDFDWLTKDSDGKSELDRFVDWYKYRHKRGVNPFEFPSISNFNIYGSTKTCYYKITSGLSMQKSGFCMRVTMTWQEYYSGLIEIPDQEVSVSSLTVYVDRTRCRAKIIFSAPFSEEPLNDSYPILISTAPISTATVKYTGANATLASSYGNYTQYLFPKPATKGTYYAIVATRKDGGTDYSEEFSESELNILTSPAVTFTI